MVHKNEINEWKRSDAANRGEGVYMAMPTDAIELAKAGDIGGPMSPESNEALLGDMRLGARSVGLSESAEGHDCDIERLASSNSHSVIDWSISRARVAARLSRVIPIDKAFHSSDKFRGEGTETPWS